MQESEKSRLLKASDLHCGIINVVHNLKHTRHDVHVNLKLGRGFNGITIDHVKKLGRCRMLVLRRVRFPWLHHQEIGELF